MNPNIEIIDFYWPNSNRKNLYITNIPGDKHEDDISVFLYNTFSKYGLIYGTQVYTGVNGQNNYTTSTEKNQDCEKIYYAFVTFYSMLDAARAKDDMNGILVIGDNICKGDKSVIRVVPLEDGVNLQKTWVAYAKRKKEMDEQKVLYFSKCYELVNYYLGFNSWSTQIKTMFEDTDSCIDTDQTSTVKYVCLIKLTVRDLSTEGIGVWQESFSTTDPQGKIKAVCKSKKCCHMRAIENAFSKVLLIVLDNGKVTVEIDTTKPDFHSDNIQDEQLVKVNTLDTQPESEEPMADIGDETWNASDSNMDDINLHILQQLEDDMS